MREPSKKTPLGALRLARGLTQAALADRAGISRQAYAAIEAGSARPSVDVALRVAASLDATVESLFGAQDAGDSISLPLVGTALGHGPFPVRIAEVAGRRLAYPTGRGIPGVTHADGTATRDDGTRVRVRLFANRPPPPDLVVAGCDPAFALAAEGLRRRGLHVLWLQAGSRAAMEMLARGEAHVGGIHLSDPQSGASNRPWVERLIPGACSLVRFATWEESLLLARGNPLGVGGIADVARPGTRFVNREEGSGSRALVDRALSILGVPAEEVGGYHTTRASSHLEVAAAVASGAADAGVGIRAAGALYGLHAVTLGDEPYDLVIPTPLLDLPAVQALLEVLGSRSLRDQVGALDGYDTSAMGTPA